MAHGSNPTPPESRGFTQAYTLGTELVCSILAMAALGWGLDYWLGSSPKALLTCLAVGFVGGGYNFMRRALALSKATTATFRHDRAVETIPKKPASAPKTSTSSAMFTRSEGVIDESDDDRELSPELRRELERISGLNPDDDDQPAEPDREKRP